VQPYGLDPQGRLLSMGSKGSKPRKPKHSQHLPKVGTSTENERLLHEEREAVLGQMGVRDSGPGVKVAVTAIIVVLIVGAILGLTLIVFR
jgi:hypothetical protein